MYSLKVPGMKTRYNLQFLEALQLLEEAFESGHERATMERY